MLRVALLGAFGTGKTQLARDLGASLNALGIPARVTTDLHGTAKKPLQTVPGPEVLLFDGDPGLWIPSATERPGAALTLLMGLDLPRPHAASGPDDPAVREANDDQLRRELQAAGIGFQTIYGQGPQRVRSALGAVGKALGTALLPDDAQLREGNGRWQCDACSDPECEHRLFSELVARQSANTSANRSG